MEGPGHLGFYHTRCQIRSHSQVPRWTKFGRDTGRSPHSPPVRPSDTPVALSRAALWLAVRPLRRLWEMVSHVGGGPARLAPWSAGTQGPPLGEPGVQALPGTRVELLSGGGGRGLAGRLTTLARPSSVSPEGPVPRGAVTWLLAESCESHFRGASAKPREVSSLLNAVALI